MFTSTPPICTGRALELSRKDSNIRYLRHLGNSDIATKLGRTIAAAVRSWAKEVGADDIASEVMDRVREGFDVVRDHAAVGQARTKARRAAKKARSAAKKAPKKVRSAAKRKTTRKTTTKKKGSPKVHVGPELAEWAPGGPVTGAFPGFSLGVLVMGQGPVEARGKRAVFSKARWARLCVRGAGSFHRACPFVTSGPRGALLHLPRVQLVKSRCPYDLRCTCVIFQPERWGPNSQTLAPLRVRAHRGDHAL